MTNKLKIGSFYKCKIQEVWDTYEYQENGLLRSIGSGEEIMPSNFQAISSKKVNPVNGAVIK